MALFGRGMARRMAPPMVGASAGVPGAMPPAPNGIKPEEMKPGGGEQVRSIDGERRPFMAAFSRKSLPRTLQIVGAAMQQMSNPAGQLNQFAANEAEQARYDTAQAAQQRTQKTDDEQRAQFEQAISSLPPDQQRWARLNPQAFAEAMMRSQGDGGWQHGQGYSNLWRPNPDGTVTLGDPLPLRPRQAPMGYNTPDDGEDWEEF